MTTHVNQVKLESQLLQEKNMTESLENFTSTMQHEFKTPLATSLDFLKIIAARQKDKDSKNLI